MSLIEVRNLEKTYDNDGLKTHVLRDVSLKIEKGEFVAVMGPSGSGKSTLLHILGFLDRPTNNNSYIFEGKEIENFNQEELAAVRNKKMGFVFQSFNLLARSTVLENVKLPLIYGGVPEPERTKKATEAIESVGLAHRISHAPSQLSGGEKQRVAIARALVNNPSVIFADEPTGNLDSKSGQVVIDLIRKLHEEKGHTIVLITHETYTAEYAERVITIRDGKIETDSKTNNRHKSKEKFVK